MVTLLYCMVILTVLYGDITVLYDITVLCGDITVLYDITVLCGDITVYLFEVTVS